MVDNVIQVGGKIRKHFSGDGIYAAVRGCLSRAVLYSPAGKINWRTRKKIGQ